MKPVDLEAFRELFSDSRQHILLALVKRVAVASDRSVCRVEVAILPEKRRLIAQMSWDVVGAESGLFMLPEVDDLVLVAQAEGDKDLAYVIARLTSKDEKIPLNAAGGDFVLKARAGKKAWVTADRINLTKGDSSPTENLVLGQVLKAALSTFMTAFENHTHVGNMGYNTSIPSTKGDVTTVRTGKVDNEDILSSVAFTEKGS